MNPVENKLKIITIGIKLLETPKNKVLLADLTNAISEHGKMYHVQIKPLKTPKKPLLNSLVNFAEGMQDMQTLLNELNHSIKV